jgi:hypothetical protein
MAQIKLEGVAKVLPTEKNAVEILDAIDINIHKNAKSNQNA